MCGIVGIAALKNAAPPAEQQIRRMCATIAHRGPDDEGVEIIGSVGIGMRRLAIIDLAGGKQPIKNENGHVTAVFNGEIYNFRELRKDLMARGHKFLTHSDTETIVHAYEEYGTDFPSHLNGMFAIALYDADRDRLLLVRDHVGIKPLFFTRQGDYLIWGSEPKAILASGIMSRQLDASSLGEFLTWEYVPGRHTLFKGMHKLLPGHLLCVDLSAGRIFEREFWDLKDAVRAGEIRTDDQWEEEIMHLLDTCVRRQLVADVPLGAFLSGGVDSSLVVSAMPPDARTFSISFDDPSYDESAYAAAVAEHLGVRHHCEKIRPYVADQFDHLMTFMDDPIGDFSIFPTFLVSKMTRRHVTVALSGDGGDELFGGYETYVADLLSQQYEKIPAFLRDGCIVPLANALKPRPAKKGFINKFKRFTEGARHPSNLGHARWRMFLSPQDLDKLLVPEISDEIDRSPVSHIEDLRKQACHCDPLTRDMYVDVKSYLVDNCLVKTDRMSMAVSLETRVPFLDKALIERAFHIPSRLKVAGRETKILLKKVAAQRVPRHCVYRTKQGFSIPIKQWLGGQFRDIMENYLDPVRLKQAGIFREDMIARLKEKHLRGVANHSHVIWSLIVFEAWRDRWLKGGT